MATRIADVVVPSIFSDYIIQNSTEKNALVQSGVMARNAEIEAQLTAGAEQFTVPLWRDLPDVEADIANDDPAQNSTPQKVGTGKQQIRKAFLHQSWSAMNLASELAGSNALTHIQSRVGEYWNRQLQRRLIASLNGILAQNVTGNAGDMLLDISGGTGDAAKFNAKSVIQACATLGDSMRDVLAIGMHSATYAKALQDDLIQTLPDSQGGFIQTFRGLAIIVDDLLPVTTGTYTTVLFGPGAVGYGLSNPRVAQGTEIESKPSAGNGGGQEVLHSRLNLAVHPLGYRWLETEVGSESPTLAELADATNWQRVADRKHIPLAFLKHKL